MLGIKVGALKMKGKCYTTEVNPSPRNANFKNTVKEVVSGLEAWEAYQMCDQESYLNILGSSSLIMRTVTLSCMSL